MDQNTTTLMFALIRSAVLGAPLTEEEKALFSEEKLKELIGLSRKHDLSHLLAYALSQSGLVDKTQAGTERVVLQAVYRYEQLNYEFTRLCEALEEAEISFLPLKGSVLRAYYPEPWMRTSCDVDVLLHPTDLERAAALLAEKLGYTCGEKTSHDISLFSQGGMHIELHYDLVEEGRANSAREILESVWESVSVREGSRYFCEMSDAMFYFYHVAHMAKHFESGGCGIRPFIDLWILDHRADADMRSRDELLQRGGLLTFAEGARKLSRVWFCGEAMDGLSRQMENYILRGGVYGSTENFVMVQQQKQGGRLRFALSRIFLPYDALKLQYPVLQKHRWLTPVMEVRRWGRVIFRGRVKHSVSELKYNQNLPMNEADATKSFLDGLGL